MSQRIVTECDECLALGKQSDGSTVGVRALSIEVEVDLCDTHVRPLVDMLERFAELGRTPTGRASGLTCPRCGRTFNTPQGLGRHTKETHGESVSEARQAASPVAVAGVFTCPECGRPAKSALALGVHRAKAHGVPGVSHPRKQGAAPAGG